MLYINMKIQNDKVLTNLPVDFYTLGNNCVGIGIT